MDREALARLVVELKTQEGSWRAVERRSGVANSTLIHLSRAALTPQEVTVHRLAQAYPEIADDLYRLTGYSRLILDIPGLAELARKMEQTPEQVITKAVADLADKHAKLTAPDE